jgi:hypothetical protein
LHLASCVLLLASCLFGLVCWFHAPNPNPDPNLRLSVSVSVAFVCALLVGWSVKNSIS